MTRRGVSMTLLILIAVQLLSVIAFAAVCPQPCSDDEAGTSCPLVCALCTSCTHGQTAIVRHASVGEPTLMAQRLVVHQTLSSSSSHADDIFHVPLFG